MNAKTRLIAAYRAIGPDTVNRLMSIGDLPAHTREEHFAPYAARASFDRYGKYSQNVDRYNLPNLQAVERYGQAAYVYAALHHHWREIAAWTGKRDWIAESAKASAIADVPPGELSDLELGCRLYMAIVEDDPLSPELVKAITDRPRLPLACVAQGIGLAVQGYASSGLTKWRSEGIPAKKGIAARALWGWWRDVGNFNIYYPRRRRRRPALLDGRRLRRGRVTLLHGYDVRPPATYSR